MKIIRKPKQMQDISIKLLKQNMSIGFVPTMGALHEGHISLIKKARKENDVAVVSIFVNVKQFGPKEDYLQYPRPFNKDKEICNKLEVDYIFAPTVADMYTKGYQTYVSVDKMSDFLCGEFRPGHFKGVATVVAKLFNIVKPDKAYFGKKDYQQLMIINKMVKDLNFRLKIVSCPTKRENKGLALSSRNQYLSQIDHNESLKIWESLQTGHNLIKCYKIKDSNKVIKKMYEVLKTIPEVKIDYIQVCDPDTLESVTTIDDKVLIAVALRIGNTRLIDNIIV